ncbi:unnamed protein product [Ectocarpus sp. 12 AP-2014]
MLVEPLSATNSATTHTEPGRVCATAQGAVSMCVTGLVSTVLWACPFVIGRCVSLCEVYMLLTPSTIFEPPNTQQQTAVRPVGARRHPDSIAWFALAAPNVGRGV